MKPLGFHQISEKHRILQPKYIWNSQEDPLDNLVSR